MKIEREIIKIRMKGGDARREGQDWGYERQGQRLNTRDEK